MSKLNEGASNSPTSLLKIFTTPFVVLSHDLKNTTLSKAGMFIRVGLFMIFLNADQTKYFSDFLSYGFSENVLQADSIEMENLISKS